MPTPRWSILFRPFPRLADVSLVPGHRPDYRLDSADRQAGGRGLGLDPGAAGDDLDRIAGRTTTVAVTRRLAAGLCAGPGRAAAQVRPAVVVALPDGVISGAGSGAAGSGAAGSGAAFARGCPAPAGGWRRPASRRR